MQLFLTKKDRLVILRLKCERKWQYEFQKQLGKMQDWEPPENVKLDTVNLKQLMSNEMQNWKSI